LVKNSNTFIGVDGFHRKQSEDAKISLNIAALFGTDLGKDVLKYLRSVTIDLVNGPAVTDGELRHVEGQRYVIGLIETRIKHAHRVKNNV
tara:strand:+ start:257 stop:526 length:270 start_codon:yes stop_codon:yes gene_type:complete